MKIVTVIPLAKGIYKEDLTYFTAKDVTEGNIVRVPLRAREILGIVALAEDASATKSDIKQMSFNLKKIIEVKDNSVFRESFLHSAMYTAKYFAAQKGTTATTLIPASFRENYDKISEFKNESKKEIIKDNLQNKIRPEKNLFQASFEDRISFYKTLIRTSFAEKKSVVFILPTEKDVELFSKSLAKGVDNFSFIFHSGLSPKKQLDVFGKIVQSPHPVVIFGTYGVLSIPREDIGTVILESESSPAYKMAYRPFLDFRTFAEIFASEIGAKLILADTLLRFETIQRRNSNEIIEIHPLSFRMNFEGKIEILNTKKEKEEIEQKEEEDRIKKFRAVSEKALEEIKNALEKKQNVFVFSLRKGLATLTVCKDCSEPVLCDNCSAPVVLYQSKSGEKRMFLCNRCHTEKDSEITCPICNSWNFTPLGIGTDLIEEELKSHFKKTPIYRLDKNSAKTAKGAEKIAKEFEEGQGNIMIGTEMAFFYLNNKVPLSVIASFDSLWSIPNFRMSEKIIQLLLSIINITEKKLIIQTKNPNDPAIKAITENNLLGFIREEIEDRKQFNYAPWKRMIKITSYSNSKSETLETKNGLIHLLQNYNPEVFSGFVSRVKGEYVTNALIKIDLEKWSLPQISSGSSINPDLLEKLTAFPPSFLINVDPEDLL
ncbi:MAG: hypothetical protein NTZ44_04250 [Candidatus Nomurabacteria bacterium]|nr:hypothetical protein [Candidatus Nomurabacteria bacterium]